MKTNSSFELELNIQSVIKQQLFPAATFFVVQLLCIAVIIV